MRRTALLALPLVLLAACSAEQEQRSATSAAPEPSASASAASATPTPRAATAAATTAPPAAPRSERAADGDVDGDGEVDDVAVQGTRVTVTLSRSGQRVSGSADSDIEPNAPVTVAGVVDADRDGRADLFVRVAQGASTTTLRVLRYDGRVLRPVDTADRPLLLTIGGTVTHGDGFSCTDEGRLVVRAAVSDEGTTFRVTTTTYALRGFVAEEVSRTTATAPQGSDEVRRAYEVDCGSVGEGE